MASKEKNSLPKRAARYAKVSTAIAGAGVRMAGARLSNKDDKQKRAELLRLALGGLKGPLMKVAQILGTIPDLVPKEYADELAQLQSDAPAMGWPFVKRRMAAELGAQWEDKFKSFEHTAAHAASLGQVHRAVGLDGKKLACKLQYPDMASAVEADLTQLKLLLSIFERYDKAVSTKEIQLEIADRLREELDYGREAKHIGLYRAMLADVDTVHIPQVVGKLSTDRLLTIDWLEGEKFTLAAEKRSLKDRNAIATNMFRAWYTSFYRFGVIHGDPHLGNYTIRPDNGVNLLDFGCIRVFKPTLVASVIQLYGALKAKDQDMAVEAYKGLGFANPSKALIDALNLWAQFLYAPILEDKIQPIEKTNTGTYGRQTANKVHAELRKIGGITVPREFVFMDRAAVGLGSVFLRLRAEVNWYRLFHEMVEDFDVKALAKKQSTMLKQNGL